MFLDLWSPKNVFYNCISFIYNADTGFGLVEWLMREVEPLSYYRISELSLVHHSFSGGIFSSPETGSSLSSCCETWPGSPLFSHIPFHPWGKAWKLFPLTVYWSETFLKFKCCPYLLIIWRWETLRRILDNLDGCQTSASKFFLDKQNLPWIFNLVNKDILCASHLYTDFIPSLIAECLYIWHLKTCHLGMGGELLNIGCGSSITWKLSTLKKRVGNYLLRASFLSTTFLIYKCNCLPNSNNTCPLHLHDKIRGISELRERTAAAAQSYSGITGFIH